jgi:ABC-type amino acid transport substrate-binding protein
LDALLISAESGSAYTLLYPEFQVVVPAGASVKLPLFYALGTRDDKFLEFLNHWLSMRKHDGTTQEYYEHWILGKSAGSTARRWCVIRDVLHWVD